MFGVYLCCVSRTLGGTTMVQVKLGAYRFRKEIITELRQQLGLSQAEMGAKITVPKNTVSRWETGATVPDALQLAAIYSIGMEQGITPNFFARAKKQQKKKHKATTRTTALVYWDMQNVAPGSKQVGQWEAAIEKAVKSVCGQAVPTSKVFHSPDQQKAVDKLEGWRKQVCDEDCDERIISQVRSDAGHNPSNTAVFLITRDRGYVNLIKEQRAKNVLVYVITPPNVSKKLVSAVGEEYLITLP